MDFNKLIKDLRYSCRSYRKEKVSSEDMERILDAGVLAPTAVNYQPQRILVVDDEEGMSKLAGCTNYTFGAPSALIVGYDRSEAWVRKYDGKSSGDTDASIVADHMMLQASELGLGTCWVGHFDPEKLRNEFEIPENIIPVMILIVGHPDEKGVPSPRHSVRRSKDETVFRGRFR